MKHLAVTAGALICAATLATAHGDVSPQPVDTAVLPDVEAELLENPYRDLDLDTWRAAIEIGASGYNQNCARCHGLEVISGGLAPDLRFLEAEEYGDEWYMERYNLGYTQNGITKMPAFGELLGDKAAWAIRTYIETRPDDEMIAERSEELRGMRDQFRTWAEDANGSDADAAKERLATLAAEIETLSGAPIADSIAYRASFVVDGTEAGYAEAAEILTIGLSAAN